MTLGGDPLPVSSERLRLLLVYLLLHRGTSVSRTHLSFQLWPDTTETRARASLRYVLHQLRSLLPEPDRFLEVSAQSLRWDVGAPFRLDVAEFEQALADAERADAGSDYAATCHALTRALDHYGGALLPDVQDVWLLPFRASLENRFSTALQRLITLRSEHDEVDEAIRLARQMIRHDPLHEGGYAQLITLHGLRGDYEGVKEVYRESEAILRKELGIAPGPTLQNVYAQWHGPRQEASEASTAARLPRKSSVLPTPASPLIGRHQELTALSGMLKDPSCRLLTIVGAGGIGKTRLALEVAHEQHDTFAEGSVMVSLAPVTSVEFLLPTIADALGLKRYRQGDLREQLLAHLQKRRMLLLLDNAEHLVDGFGIVMEILQAAPNVKFLVTSRERLHMYSEWVFELQGLAAPTDRSTRFENYAAIELFLYHARRAQKSFSLTPANSSAITRICQLVDGMPLGLELAAAWVRVLPVEAIAQEIGNSLDFLAASGRDLPTRHRSLRAAFEHSWELLTPPEQRAMSRLSIFHGGFRRDAAERVAGVNLMILSALADKSLVRRANGGRYDLHELIRQYAREKLVEEGAIEHARDQHLSYYTTLAVQAEQELYGPDQSMWLERLEEEHDNLRGALEWAVSSSPRVAVERVEQGLLLASKIYRFWQGHGHLAEGQRWLERGLRHSEEVSLATRATAMDILGWLVHMQGDSRAAHEWQEKSLALYREARDVKGISNVLDSLGDTAWAQGEFVAARSCYEESLSLRRELNDEHAIGLSLYSLGRLHVDYGDETEAAALFNEALPILERLEDQRGVALTLNGLGRLALKQKVYESAEQHIKTCLVMFEELGNRVDIAECLEELATLAHHQGKPLRAARLQGATASLHLSLGVPVRTSLDLTLNLLEAALDSGEIIAAWNEGHQLAPGEAIRFALET